MAPRVTTPMMEQYARAKAEAPGALLFFRMGDFYELFHEDAKEASRLIGLTLTSRSKEPEIPMAGVPVRSLDGYLRKLVALGRRVAICEQIQDPREAKGIVERALVRVVTPGTLTEDSALDQARPNFLAAVAPGADAHGVAWIDLSTGAFRVQDVPEGRLGDTLARIDPAELLVPESWLDAHGKGVFGEAVEREPQAHPDWTFEHSAGRRALLEQLGTHDLDGFGCEAVGPALGAAGAILDYLRQTQRTALDHVRRLVRHRDEDHLLLDRVTRASLELTETLRERRREGSLLWVLDRTQTALGARRLRSWLLEPLRERRRIERRQDGVAELVDDSPLRDRIVAALEPVRDIERIVARVSVGRANARDLVSIRSSLRVLPGLRALLEPAVSAILLDLREAIDPLEDLTDVLERSLVDEPPPGLKEGGLIREGWSGELDDLRSLRREGRSWIASFQEREIERTGIANLKVGFNRVFGYYIEITHANAGGVPDDYQRRQTLKNAERYVTPELKEYEQQVLTADERAQDLEYDLFLDVRGIVAEALDRLLVTAAALSRLDALTSLALAAAEHGYVRPELTDDTDVRLEDSRHPVVERIPQASGEGFVANDLEMDAARRVLVITGPNMAGKSTYIRQAALLVLMAQIGSFVPARSARIGIADRIFARVGASDELTRGRSTFMVEMTETANILNNATDRSLVILDEVGRGTSTYDGVSLAWAVTEHIANRIGCRTLFATHYHEITELADLVPGIHNVSVEVREWGDDIVFLRRIVPGATDRSYGIHVARLAGVPGSVLDRARVVLHGLEEGAHAMEEDLRRREDPAAPRPDSGQLGLFAAPPPPPDPLREEIRVLDLDRLTPIDALLKLRDLRDRTREGRP